MTPGRHRTRRILLGAASHGVLGLASLGVLVPIVCLIVASFKTIPEIFANPYGLPEQWQWENYTRAWHEARISITLVNSIIVTSTSVLASTFLAAMIGYGLNRKEKPLAMVLYTLFVSGMLVPLQMVVLPLFLLLRDIGVLGTLLALILPYTAMGLPMGVLILTPLISTMPRDLWDAARIDRASEWQIFTHIVLPMLRPGLASVVILNGVWTWNEFFVPLVLAVTPGTQTLPVGIMSFVGAYSTEWGLIFASVVVSTAPVVIAYVAMSRQFIAGLAAGAIKG
jgi:raffinose/stachyose/melibiose transport system permease protein